MSTSSTQLVYYIEHGGIEHGVGDYFKKENLKMTRAQKRQEIHKKGINLIT